MEETVDIHEHVSLDPKYAVRAIEVRVVPNFIDNTSHMHRRSGRHISRIYTVHAIGGQSGMYIHVLMRDEKEKRKKQARSNKQTNKQGKATQHTQGSHFS